MTAAGKILSKKSMFCFSKSIIRLKMSELASGSFITVGSKTLLLHSELGRGGFGVVFRAIDQNSGRHYALKDVKCRDEEDRDLVVREVNSLVSAKHEHIVQIMGVDTCVISSKTHFLILTEFCSGGDLNKRLERPSSYQTEVKWLQQMSSAVRYIHSCNPPIVHRDLKVENVLLADPRTEDLKLADLGLAREYSATGSSSMDVSGAYMTSQVGTPNWMAPEVFLNHYTEKADIFSLGVIFYAILARHCRQVGSKKMYGVFVDIPGRGAVGMGMAMIALNRRLEVPFSSSCRGCNVVKNIVQAMLEREPGRRPTAEQVYQTVCFVCASLGLPGQAGYA